MTNVVALRPSGERPLVAGLGRLPHLREDPLRSLSGIVAGMAMTSWRGRSGRRYVTTVHAADGVEIADTLDAAVIAVRRLRGGGAEPLGAAAFGSDGSSPARLSWVAGMRAHGATEMHVHFLPDGPNGRRDALLDLGGASQV